MTPLPRRTALAALATFALLLTAAGPAAAQAWPNKPIRLIVGFPPGGAADTVARAVAQPLQEALGQPIVIENRAGSSGNVGGDAVAKSPADGYTFLAGSGSLVSVNPFIYPKMPFDPVKDLTPVAATAKVLVFLVVKPSLPVDDAKAFVAYLKANPGKLTYGTPGNGSSPHLAGEMFKSQAGVFAVHVPYRGAAPALQDLLAGTIDYTFDPGVALPHVRAGKLKLLAVGSAKRSPLFPDVPTVEEATGLKGFDADTTFGIYAPAGTPADIVTRLNREINRALALPAVRERISAIGGLPAPMTAAQYATSNDEDSKRFGAIIKARKITAD